MMIKFIPIEEHLLGCKYCGQYPFCKYHWCPGNK